MNIKGLYCITSYEHSLGRCNVEVVRAMLEGGAKIIQYREKYASKKHKYNECVQIIELVKEFGAYLIVNDDIDIAMLVGAYGIHLGQDDLPIEQARKIVGSKMIIGISTHSPAQAEAAVQGGAGYIGVGPIFATKTKVNVCDAVGLEYLDYAVKNIKIPFVAIGGIKTHNLDMVLNKGAKCVAMVTEIVGAQNIKEKTASLVNRII
ncbi:MAG: thiamine phosphate synthase [Endomicrobiales bacterium]|nr:thiamine phosphate synthase [Endomicrobiales bacterium]